MRIPSTVLSVLVLGLSACSGGEEPPAPPASGEAIAPEAPLAPETAGGAQPAAESGIPQTLQGRWGLVPADCTSTRGDAKGLLTVGPDQLRFYESVATIGKVKVRTARSVSASFAFSGEGESWNLDVSLSSPDEGRTLVRKDTGPDAAPEPLTYTRCP